ncbi:MULTISPECIES: asparagine synthetase A [Streptomyces]|uniref:asparagine synthetase A n=1 Tax=Streptomyces TaxID=1883 RepID=UPI000A7FA69B|nr:MULTISPECIES: asparagine synthetase A [Streptomyces]MDX2537114.1 asparagine synthetase A [Streptomyces scabiei]MDX2575488.1 asparagine synthetase A [Streptomyces scabiei]MDX2653032.1 asparagine synthetase A [Streptomyces scabiei]MDX2685025.1 asparagine synthetase A [Streptomyces scabiei]MDX2718789.1 asparagine synthetase A [Streptomyces scabiei]
MSQGSDLLDASPDDGAARSREQRTRPPGLWADPVAHLASAVEHPWYRIVTAVNASILASTSSFYQSRNVSPVLMPVTVSSVSSPMGLGSDSLPVQIDLLGDRTYLADSMQFQLEFMLRHGLEGAYYVMPSFRGEDADQTHLNQFFHSEAEICGGQEEVMSLVEAYMGALTEGLLEGAVGAHIERCAGTTDHLEELLKRPEFPRITYDEAQDLLGSNAFTLKAPEAPAITRHGEQALIEHFGGAVWLSSPPSLTVPFYQRVDERGRAHSADLLLGIGEVLGCGARHITGEETRQALADHLIPESDYTWYVRMKDDYPLETAGFGLGLERFLLWVMQHDDIRDLHVMPRIAGKPSWV